MKWFLWFFFYSFIAVLHAATVAQGPTVHVTDTQATVTWTTDVSTNTKAAAGSDPDALLLKAEGEPGLTHSVTFNNLKSGSTYHYAVGSARKWLQQGTFTTLGKHGKSVEPVTISNGDKTETKKAEPPVTKEPSLFSQIVSSMRKEKSSETKAKPQPKPAAQAEPQVMQPAAAQAPPTSRSWNSMASLQDHYDRHGPDFASKSADDYAAQAWHFLQRAKRESLPMKLDEADGTVRVWDPKTRDFAAYTERGRTRTYFRPNNPSYWDRQPGRPIKPSELPF